jgi:hypothetical protein
MRQNGRDWQRLCTNIQDYNWIGLMDQPPKEITEYYSMGMMTQDVLDTT